MFSWKIHSEDVKEEDRWYMKDVRTHFSFELTSKVVSSALWFFLLYMEWLIWTLALFNIFLLFEKKKKSECEEAYADCLHLHFLTGSRAVGKSRTANAPLFQHHLLLTGHCFPKHYYCFRLSLKGDVTFIVTSEMTALSALRSGVYSFTFCRGWLADTAAGCS